MVVGIGACPARWNHVTIRRRRRSRADPTMSLWKRLASWTRRVAVPSSVDHGSTSVTVAPIARVNADSVRSRSSQSAVRARWAASSRSRDEAGSSTPLPASLDDEGGAASQLGFERGAGSGDAVMETVEAARGPAAVGAEQEQQSPRQNQHTRDRHEVIRSRDPRPSGRTQVVVTGGSSISKVQPPSTLATAILPSWDSTTPRAIARPSPPPGAVLVDGVRC